MGRSELSLIQGTLDLLVLEALARQPMHGYGVASWVRGVTGGELVIEDGALYTALHRMERHGWLESTWGHSENNRRAKYYSLTARGRRRLAVEQEQWERYAAAVRKVLKAKEAG
ncbi:MAG: PadR family transcriptional regulator [Gemmatimonadetes bacterium]|nr:PadR family transcriptional regulator [Gemmatimonadota bacterium]